MLNKNILIVLGLVIVLGAGYLIYQPKSTIDDENEQQEEKNLKVIQMDVNNKDNFSITLDSNPSTGYVWGLNLDTSYVQLIRRGFVSDNSELTEKPLVGGDQEERFDFIALQPGEVEVKFFYEREFEKDIPSLKERIYNIIIN